MQLISSFGLSLSPCAFRVLLLVFNVALKPVLDKVYCLQFRVYLNGGMLWPVQKMRVLAIFCRIRPFLKLVG